MKKIYTLALLAFSALAIAGCSKEEVFQDETEGTHTLTFKIQKDIDTKTAIVEGDDKSSYVWTEGDEAYMTVYENGIAAQSVSMTLSNNNKTATVKATFQNTDKTEFEYTATFAKNISNNKNALIQNEQSPALNSFDPSADVMVSAEPIVLDNASRSDANTEFLFTLKRVVSVNKMTLKGLNPGEKISTVEMNSDAYFSSWYSPSENKYTGESRKLILDYSKIDDAIADESGTFPVYFVSAPITDASFSVHVLTDQNVYDRDDFSSKLTLSVGQFRRFGVNLSEYGSPILSVDEYKLVDDNDNIQEGAEYLIVSTKSDGGFVSAGTFNGGNYYDAATVPVSDGVVTIAGVSVTVFTLEAANDGRFYIIDSDGKYLYSANSNNVFRADAKESTDTYLWTVTKDGITNVGTNRLMKFNRSNPRFACYNSGQADISLYVNEATITKLADPEISFTGESSYTISWDDKDSFTAPTLSNPHSLPVTYSSTEESVATVNENGAVTFIGNGTTTITATSEKTSVYKAGTAEYTLTITGAPVSYAFTNVAGLNALATSDETEVFGTLTNAVVSFVPDNKNAVIKDATGSILLFLDGHGLIQGQTYTGEVTATIKLYQQAAELTDIDAEFTGTGALVNPEITTLDNLVGNFSTYQNAYVKVEDLTVDSVSGKNITVKNGDNTYVVYSSHANATCKAGDVIEAIGTIAHYGTSDQIKVWNEDDITITYVAPTLGETLDFTSMGYSNAQEVINAASENFTVLFDKGTSSNAPKYFTTGTAVRVYGGGCFTVSSSKTINKVVIAFGSGDGSNAITVDSGTYASDGVWTGSANSVTFTIAGDSGHRRIKSITVY